MAGFVAGCMHQANEVNAAVLTISRTGRDTSANESELSLAVIDDQSDPVSSCTLSADHIGTTAYNPVAVDLSIGSPQ